MSETQKPHLKFEDCIEIIDRELAKKRNKWTLTSLAYIDWSDIEQIIRLHIWKKWSKYSQDRPLAPWLSVIISHQISNLIRNHYSNYSKPCSKCDAAEGSDGCKIYNIQCSKCPLYADWEKKKQPAQFIKMAAPIDNHIHEISEIPIEEDNLSENILLVHAKMKEELKPIEYQVYEGLFILHEDEETVAKKIGLTTNEKGRKAGYKTTFNIKKIIIDKVKKYLKNGEIELL